MKDDFHDILECLTYSGSIVIDKYNMHLKFKLTIESDYKKFLFEDILKCKYFVFLFSKIKNLFQILIMSIKSTFKQFRIFFFFYAFSKIYILIFSLNV